MSTGEQQADVVSIDPEDTEWVISAISDLKLVSYTSVVGTTILVFDCLLTFDLELRHIWRASWSALKVLYILTRYLPFLGMVPLMYHLIPGLSIDACRILVWFAGLIYTSGMASSELVLMLRTWAVWGRNPKIGLLLLVAFVFACAPLYYTLITYLKSIVYDTSPPPGAPECLVLSSDRPTMTFWCVMMGLEGLVLVLTLIKTTKNYRHNMALSRLIVKDGILYYAVLFTLSLLNVLIIATQPELVDLLMATPLRAIHSVLTARMVLRMREQNRLSMVGGLGPGTNPSLVFAPIAIPTRATQLDERDAIEMDVTSWWAEERRGSWRNEHGAEGSCYKRDDRASLKNSMDRSSISSGMARSDG
ncbi:hypothetical protein BV22DRAFT_433532 [Leucogyrophana mollusca]|uniref:Uncharacterized protein n=1 Tax=Leucogyrophana mollusca TaxID=85980 RepID=A0ACB8BJ17_9AGAM|nr:hypothetical protein BV22DRAFT_433532 [Leucogyrophana mollusca]